MSSRFLCHVYGHQSEFIALFMVFNLWNGPGAILAFYLIFNFSVATSLLLPLDWICSQVHNFMSCCFCGAL
jgi:hypothetical protein